MMRRPALHGEGRSLTNHLWRALSAILHQIWQGPSFSALWDSLFMIQEHDLQKMIATTLHQRTLSVTDHHKKVLAVLDARIRR